MSKFSAGRAHLWLYNLVINPSLFSNMTEGNFKFKNCLEILASKGVKVWNLHFKTFSLLFERLFLNSLLSCCNKVRQVYVRRKSTHEILYRRIKRGHNISGFAFSKTSQSMMFTKTCALFKAVNLFYDVRCVPTRGTQTATLRQNHFRREGKEMEGGIGEVSLADVRQG